MTDLVEHAPLDTRVAWVCDLLERITVDGREERAVAIWKDRRTLCQPVGFSNSSLRRDGANLRTSG